MKRRLEDDVYPEDVEYELNQYIQYSQENVPMSDGSQDESTAEPEEQEEEESESLVEVEVEVQDQEDPEEGQDSPDFIIPPDSEEEEPHISSQTTQIVQHDNDIDMDYDPRNNPNDPFELALALVVPQGDADAGAGPPAPVQQPSSDEETEDGLNGENLMGFHYCPLCVPYSTCDGCHRVQRTERLTPVGPEHSQEPEAEFHGYADDLLNHMCDVCTVNGLCDACGWIFRQQRLRAMWLPLTSSSASSSARARTLRPVHD